jgi:hypothetical protein
VVDLLDARPGRHAAPDDDTTDAVTDEGGDEGGDLLDALGFAYDG